MSADRPGTLDTAAVEHLLRDHLGRRADSAEPSLAPVGAVTHRARRRERRQVLLAGAAVVAMVAGGAVVASPWLDGSSRSLPSTSTDPGPDGRWTVYDLPTRGDLADSARWREAARDELGRVSRLYESPLELDHVVFAGHLSQGVALVVTTLPDRPDLPDFFPAYTLLWSPSGDPADLAFVPLRGPVGSSGTYQKDRSDEVDVIAAAVVTRDGSPYAVAVPLVPARTVSFSTGPVIGRDGAPRRSWTDVAVEGGVAITALDRSVPILSPIVTVDDSRPWPAVMGPANDPATVEAFVGETAQAWGIGPVPSDSVVGLALTSLLDVVPVDRLTVEPVSHGRELPSKADVVTANVRLDDGSVLQVAALDFDDPDNTGRTKAGAQLVNGRAVAAAEAATTPFAWLDDVSSSDGIAAHARARMVLPGAARMEVRDVGDAPCAPNRVLASADVDVNGLATAIVDIPFACAGPLHRGEAGLNDYFPDVVAVALDARGREIGRRHFEGWSRYEITDTDDYFRAITP